ncbi:MAG: cysteine-rich CWC family protein [Bacteroidales bacterium]|nr:cysteine-rich CWC family protein [Bacteroidales bacterium]
MKSTNKPKISICPKCQAQFTCNPTGNCWCSKLYIPPKNLEFLNKTYAGCLCPKCLDDYKKNDLLLL